jgi:Icc-related predicted phosphoesterase
VPAVIRTLSESVAHRLSGTRLTDPHRPLVRVAAIADTHIRPTSVTRESALAGLEELADVLLVAGDITDSGRIPEVEIAASAFRKLNLPIYAVLGNHDRRGLRRMAMRKTLAAAGVRLLDGEFDILQLPNGARVGIAGITGTGGGFGEEKETEGPGGRLTRAVMLKSRREATRLDRSLTEMASSEPDISMLVTHFAPTTDTLGAEPPLKYWMLGNAGLGKVIDDHRLDLVIHGHAHLGNEAGTTPGGTPVRNVAAPIVGRIMVYHVGPGRNVEYASGPRPAMIDHDDPIGTRPSLPIARP